MCWLSDWSQHIWRRKLKTQPAPRHSNNKFLFVILMINLKNPPTCYPTNVLCTIAGYRTCLFKQFSIVGAIWLHCIWATLKIKRFWGAFDAAWNWVEQTLPGWKKEDFFSSSNLELFSKIGLNTNSQGKDKHVFHFSVLTKLYVTHECMWKTSCNVSVKTWGNFLGLKFFELFEALFTCDENAYFMSVTTNGSKKIENQSCHCAQTGTINLRYQIRQNSRTHQPIAIEFG